MADVEARPACDEPGVEDRERVVREPHQVGGNDRDEDLRTQEDAEHGLRPTAQHGSDPEADDGRQDDERRDGDEDTAAAGTSRVLPEAREQEGQGRRHNR